MTKYIARRLLIAVPMLLGAMSIVFFAMRVLPGDPCMAMMGDQATSEALADCSRNLGLHRPLAVQQAQVRRVLRPRAELVAAGHLPDLEGPALLLVLPPELGDERARLVRLEPRHDVGDLLRRDGLRRTEHERLHDPLARFSIHPWLRSAQVMSATAADQSSAPGPSARRSRIGPSGAPTSPRPW